MKRKKITNLVLNKKRIANFSLKNQIIGAGSRVPCPEPDTEGTCAPTADTICQSIFPLC